MSDLTERLRCRYPIGPIIDGEPEFGWRDFSGPAPEGTVFPSPIMIEAANRIEELEKQVESLASGFLKSVEILAKYDPEATRRWLKEQGIEV